MLLLHQNPEQPFCVNSIVIDKLTCFNYRSAESVVPRLDIFGLSFMVFVSGRAATSGARLNLEARALAAVAGVKVERRGQRGRAIP